MRKVKIVSRKYDGRLRDEYEAFLIAEDRDMLQVFAPPGTRSFDHRKGQWFAAPDGLLELYFKTHWYVVWHMCEKQHPATNNSYVHIASPATLRGNLLEWTDLDLDYRVHVDGTVEKLDEDEFEHNRVAMHYPADVVAQAQAAFEEAGQLCRARHYPFDYQAQVRIYQTAKAQLNQVARL